MEKIFTVGITGGTGSGKSFLINYLKSKFTTAHVCTISQDNYYKELALQKQDENHVFNFDLPSSIDLRLFEQHVRHLKAGTPIEKLEYTYNNVLRSPRLLSFNPAPILIVEGLYLLHKPSIASLIDYMVFIDCDETVRLSRRIARDDKERNYNAHDVRYRFYKHAEPAYKKYIEPYRTQCQVRINNTLLDKNAINSLVEYIKTQVIK